MNALFFAVGLYDLLDVHFLVKLFELPLQLISLDLIRPKLFFLVCHGHSTPSSFDVEGNHECTKVSILNLDRIVENC